SGNEVVLRVLRAAAAPPSAVFLQAEGGIRDFRVTGVQTCALPIYGIATGKGADDIVRDLGKVIVDKDSFRQAGTRVFSKAQYRKIGRASRRERARGARRRGACGRRHDAGDEADRTRTRTTREYSDG